VVDDEGRLRPVTTINELTARLEAVEEEHQQGPCVDAFHEGTAVVIPRIADSAHRWPDWSAKASELGVRSVLGIPLRVDDRTLGAMNIYAAGERDWQAHEVDVTR
jgi:GAF domain-containing protein